MLGTTSLAAFSMPTIWPIDWVILIVLAALLALDAFRSGGARVQALAIGFPLATVIVPMISNTFFIGTIADTLSSPLAQALLFLTVAFSLFVSVYRMLFNQGYSTGGIVQAVISGLAAACIVIAVWVQVPALASIWHFSAEIEILFGESYRLFWIFGGYTLLAFIAG